MPPDTILGAHWIQTPNYVQVTGTGNLDHLLIPKGDPGGELDPHVRISGEMMGVLRLS